MALCIWFDMGRSKLTNRYDNLRKVRVSAQRDKVCTYKSCTCGLKDVLLDFRIVLARTASAAGTGKRRSLLQASQHIVVCLSICWSRPWALQNGWTDRLRQTCVFPKNRDYSRNCTLVMRCEDDGSICSATAMRAVATITVETCLLFMIADMTDVRGWSWRRWTVLCVH